MAEKGLPRVTTREVAERADLNPGLVRYYFGGKDGLLRAVVEEISREGEALAAGWGAHEGDAQTRMRGLIASMIESFFDDPYAARLLFEQVLFADEGVVSEYVDEFAQSHFAALRSVVEGGQESGEFRDLDPDMLVATITGASVFMFLAWPAIGRILHERELTSERVARLAEVVTSMVLNGITTQENER